MASVRAGASCVLDTPASKPTFIRLLTDWVALAGKRQFYEKPVAALIINVRSADVVVYSAEGLWADDVLCVKESGAIYALPHSPEALEAFARDLLSTTILAGQGDTFSLRLPEVWQTGKICWKKVCLGLYSKEDVTVDPQYGDSIAVRMGFPALEDGPRLWRSRPAPGGAPKALASVEVDSQVSEYSTAHMMPLPGRARGSSPDEHVYPAGTHEEYTRLRDGDMQRLVDALTALLRQALRYRGKLPPPEPKKRKRYDYDSVVDSDSGAEESESQD